VGWLRGRTHRRAGEQRRHEIARREQQFAAVPLDFRLSRTAADRGQRAPLRRRGAFVEINENVRGEDVFVVQSTSIPANDNLMELLICIDALRRASAKADHRGPPYFGYARQDRKAGAAHARSRPSWSPT
jgi:hypothetical protein